MIGIKTLLSWPWGQGTKDNVSNLKNDIHMWGFRRVNHRAWFHHSYVSVSNQMTLTTFSFPFWTIHKLFIHQISSAMNPMRSAIKAPLIHTIHPSLFHTHCRCPPTTFGLLLIDGFHHQIKKQYSLDFSDEKHTE